MAIEPEKEGILRQSGPVAPAREAKQVILQVKELTVSTPIQHQTRTLVSDISFTIHKGETLALVGESGSGKSVTACAIAGLLSKSLQIQAGVIYLEGENMQTWPVKKWKQIRGKRIGWVFQNYQGSFTPFIRIGNQLIEMLRTHNKGLSRRAAKEIVLAWLERTALPPKQVYESYPFQLSGGQRQRIALAAALMLEPSLLIADEPTTALDVLTGEKVLDLMDELQAQTGCAILLISHHLRQVLKRADQIAVMKEGQLMEIGTTAQIREQPIHAYTRSLLHACPRLTLPDQAFGQKKSLILSAR
ncbi:ABC transporter ATP-binding protein [Paenibacillus sp. y28]|uniref:ABC transporter ATP-binding protein n=1 Tax=Paenibacillus sp. y28 TaxID=3129110 RepID=UPI003015DEC1